MRAARASCCWSASAPDVSCGGCSGRRRGGRTDMSGTRIGAAGSPSPCRDGGGAGSRPQCLSPRRTRPGRTMDATASELVVDRRAEAVPRARRFVADALRASRPLVADDAELVASELVTNALLHGAPPVRLRIRPVRDRVRIEVEDAGREMPMRMREDTNAMTGRGLALVSKLAQGWGA